VAQALMFFAQQSFCSTLIATLASSCGG